MKKFNSSIFILIIGCFIFLFSCKDHNVTINPADIAYYSRRIVNLNQLGADYITNLDQKVFSAVMEGKIKVYKEDSLTPRSLFTINELKDRLSHKETVTLTPNPNIPTYTIDTVVVTPFKVNEIVGHSIGEKWIINKEADNFRGIIFAFGLNWKPVIANIELHEQPAFWISYDDLKKVLTPSEIKTFNKAIYEAMIKRLSDY